ncbi:MAG: glucosaminidase domain-containing protein [Rhodocyclaceae bacterium]
MRLAELPAFNAPSADFRAAVRDTALPLQGEGGFAGLYRQLSGEVADFIAHGSDGRRSEAATLSVEGRAWQARLGAPDAPAGDDAEGVATLAQKQFLARIAPLAQEASRALGVAPEVLSAQAALETGWGQRSPRGADGQDSHNLFGIKATEAWQGEAVQAATHEFENGRRVPRTDDFRAYASDAASFRDLTTLLRTAPRYQAALGTGTDARAYGQALQRGGYATDPAYADKLARIAARIQSGD